MTRVFPACNDNTSVISITIMIIHNNDNNNVDDNDDDDKYNSNNNSFLSGLQVLILRLAGNTSTKVKTFMFMCFSCPLKLNWKRSLNNHSSVM